MLLTKAALLSPEDVAKAGAQADSTGRPLWEVILDGKLISEEQLAEAIARYTGVPYVRLAVAAIEPQAVARLPEALAAKFACIPVKLEEKAVGHKQALVLAMVNPTDMEALRDLEFSTGLAVQPVVATRSEIEDALGRFYSPDKWMQGFLKNVSALDELEIVGGGEDIDEEHSALEAKAPAVKVVNLVLQQGIKIGASDIHIEPEWNELKVRARQGGMLREILKAPKWLHEPLVSRLKILAKLDISERRRPQDGRIKVAFHGQSVDLRLSTLPTHFGEKLVLRILGSAERVPPTAALGLSAEDLGHFRKAVDQPQGLILVTGPTGSGKTTTLYSAISEKRSPSTNIITVEDPIEFQLPGINQVQVNNKAGLTFASSLRAILRQDPDVILVGEIRDEETAEIAFHAGMTGHLVFSTLHTNSTVATVARLLDLGLEPYLIASSVNLIMAQRLARAICASCKEPYEPPVHLLERLNLRPGAQPFYHGRGCEDCEQTGYSGRIGLYEVLRFTPKLKRLISQKAPEGEMLKAALAGGTRLLLDAALEQVRSGRITVEEVLRIIQIQEEEVHLCPQCSRSISLDFPVCPYCSFVVRRVCTACQQELSPEWQICPYCRTKVPAAAVQTAAQPTTKHATAPRILVVDDDPVSRRLAVKALQKLDLQPDIVEAVNGAEALAEVAARTPDLIVLDVMMPGMSGFEVCQKLRADLHTTFIPILMLTANTDEDSRTQGFVAGTDDYVGKPFSVLELHARVRRLLRRTYGL